MKEKPTAGSPFVGASPSDRIRKTTKYVNVLFFIHSSNSRKLYQRIPVKCTREFRELFEAATNVPASPICIPDMDI
jgi:hypothetical protein